MRPDQSQAIAKFQKSAAMNCTQTVKALDNATTRRQVEAILVARTKGDLWQLCKYLGTLRIPSDRKADLVHRIADATVGYRERNAQIRGDVSTKQIVEALLSAESQREAREILFDLMRDQVFGVCANLYVNFTYSDTKPQMVAQILRSLHIAT